MPTSPYALLTLLFPLLFSGGCFNPEDPSTPAQDESSEPAEEGAGDVCIEFEEPCESNLDCCNYDPEFPVGSSQCVAVSASAPASCASVCQNNDDCATDCCAALEGVSDYGACVDTEVCEGN